VQLAAQAARQAGATTATPEHGPWRITLDYPSFGPFLEHSQRRDLREQLYRAFITRASSGAEDNTTLLRSILSLRQEQARLLGYGSFAELSLASKMAPDVATVERFLEELRQASCTAAQQDLEDLRTVPALPVPQRQRTCATGIWRFGPSACGSSAMILTTKNCGRIFRCRASSMVYSLWLSAFLPYRFGQQMEKRPYGTKMCASSASTMTRSGLSRPFILTRTADRPRSVVGVDG